MNDTTPTTPPFAASPFTDADHDPHWSESQTLLVLAAVAVGTVAAVIVGGLLGFLVYGAMAAECYNDGWCELGAAIVGLFVGAGLGMVAYVGAGAMLVRKFRAKGQRGTAIAIHSAVPLLLVLLNAILGALLA